MRGGVRKLWTTEDYWAVWLGLAIVLVKHTADRPEDEGSRELKEALSEFREDLRRLSFVRRTK